MDTSNSIRLLTLLNVTSILSPTALQLAQEEDRWTVASNTTTSDHRRTVCFQLQPPTPANTALRLPKTLQPALDTLNQHEQQLFDSIKHYQDVWHTGIPYDHNRGHLRTAASLWALQHILKTRAEIIKNNDHLAPHPTCTPEAEGEDPAGKRRKPTAPNADREIRDQGFTRPKVLILLPFRAAARDWVHALTALPAPAPAVKGRERFEKEYSLPEGTLDRLDAHDAHLHYPLDHRIIFRGNIDDDFFLPIKFTRKEIRLYSDFYQADLVLGSPVGLRKFIEKEGDADFLSSIEIAIVDQMDVMQMQNWDHVEFVVEHLNRLPTKPRDTDFSRVKPWYLDGHARHLRQSILFSAHVSPAQTALFRGLANVRGKALVFHGTDAWRAGVLGRVRPGLVQTWLPVDVGPEPAEEPARRLAFFRTHVLQPLLQSALVKEGLGGVLVFVPSYFDFVRLEALFRTLDVSFAAISEYSSVAETSAARSAFFNRHVSFLLVSERFHFFTRAALRGARRLVFYAPPSRPEFYLELVSQFPFLARNPRVPAKPPSDEPLLEPKDVAATVLFSPLDQPYLEPIVGLAHAHKMLRNSPAAHSFTFV
ncbi:hypothetical protein PtA15_3A457 [Puccinia triticina]|uniref:U3 small nucleolar RNA-associated protein 25 n=1 Tax=Puccinia triticina TaxID=208348 RepID=A0ABY7CGX9_9BASI|nr:uncharacterized protein PtA15_3A457 [Puccinia triticina]WAQ83090.1 hypothetical protein PtA15_3A457 [Puccinia triticina]WAR53928.1 hypothetical protein PtB15_3B437 [Puccinia triticina]